MKEKEKIVIVGSGIGGLVCGAILAKEGYNVLVLERNKQIGGCLQIFVRDKLIFNSSVHYVGGLEKGQNLYKVFKYLGIIDQLEVHKLDESAFDKIIFANDEKEYNYAQGYDNFIKTLIADFPEEEQAIKKYVEAIHLACESFPLYNLQESDDYNLSSVYAEMDTQTFIASLTDNVRLQAVLAGNNILYAGVGNKTPFSVHALVLNSYIESAWMFEKGSGQIAKLLAKVITSHGGEVKKRCDVTKFVEEDGKIKYVETKDGRKFKGDYFISNIHPAQTMEMTESTTIRPVYKNRIKSLENSVSVFVLYITFKPNSYPNCNSNYYYFENDDAWNSIDYEEEQWPLSYGLFYSRSHKDAQYAESVTIMTYMKYSEVEQWKDTYNTVTSTNFRGDGYEDFKERKKEKLLQSIYKKFPQIKDAIQSCYVSTPLSYRDYMGTDDGSIYGIMKDYKDPIRTYISPVTKVNNFFLTGQNIKLHGILGVTISSIVCCSTLLGINTLIQKIEEAQ
ncbi:MAG: NAD(P)/FAD-dependent oxidoreductase [Chitinophagales bacterium]